MEKYMWSWLIDHVIFYRMLLQIEDSAGNWTNPSNLFVNQLALCPAALLPELQPAPCFLSAIIGQID